MRRGGQIHEFSGHFLSETRGFTRQLITKYKSISNPGRNTKSKSDSTVCLTVYMYV